MLHRLCRSLCAAGAASVAGAVFVKPPLFVLDIIVDDGCISYRMLRAILNSAARWNGILRDMCNVMQAYQTAPQRHTLIYSQI